MSLWSVVSAPLVAAVSWSGRICPASSFGPHPGCKAPGYNGSCPKTFGETCIESRPVPKAMIEILLNPHAIAINQLWAGHGGDFIVDNSSDGVAVWAKPLPQGGVGVVLFRNQMTGPASLTFTFVLASVPDVYFSPKAGVQCEVVDVWKNASSTVVVGSASEYSLRYRQALLLRVGNCT
eukprot:COSAG02_NODE_124_length_35047_cov_31.554179_39_plen_179_part_00